MIGRTTALYDIVRVLIRKIDTLLPDSRRAKIWVLEVRHLAVTGASCLFHGIVCGVHVAERIYGCVITMLSKHSSWEDLHRARSCLS